MSIPLELLEAWSAKRGDVILLRLKSLNPAAFESARALLNDLEERSGVTFVLLGPDVELVNPTTGETS